MPPKRAPVPIRAGITASATSSSNRSGSQTAGSPAPPPHVPGVAAVDAKVGSKKLLDLCSTYYVQRNVKRKKPDAVQSGLSTGAGTSSAAGGRAPGRRAAGATIREQTAASSSSSSSSSNVGAATRSTRSNTNGSSSSSSSVNAPHRGVHDAAQEPEVGSGAGMPQVELGSDGQIVIRESSLQMEDAAADAEEEEYDEEQIADGTSSSATYSSFLRRRKSFTWGLEETKRFYDTLRQVGTEFSLMQSFFPGRTRKQLKSKFQKEEREHPELVRKILQMVRPLDDSAFKVQYGDYAVVTSSANGGIDSTDGAGKGGGTRNDDKDNKESLGSSLLPAYRRRKDEGDPDVFECENDAPNLVLEI